MKDTKLKYTGGGFGGSIVGWPARDLTTVDVERIEKDGVSIETLIQSGLYELAEVTQKREKPVIEKSEETWKA